MKGIIVVLLSVLAFGCSTKNPEPVATQPVINEPIPVVVQETAPAQPVTVQRSFDARIDAAGFLNALIESGCVIDKAEYKEVARGGGISVECADDSDILDSEGIGDL